MWSVFFSFFLYFSPFLFSLCLNIREENIFHPILFHPLFILPNVHSFPFLFQPNKAIIFVDKSHLYSYICIMYPAVLGQLCLLVDYWGYWMDGSEVRSFLGCLVNEKIDDKRKKLALETNAYLGLVYSEVLCYLV